MNLQELMALRADKFNAMKDLSAKNLKMDAETLAIYNDLEDEFHGLSKQIDLHGMESTLTKQVDAVLVLDDSAFASNEYRNGFDSYVAGADGADFRAVMTVGVDSDGGYIVPVTYQRDVLRKLTTLSLTRSISTVIGTESIKNIPIEGQSPTFAWVDEGGLYGETDTKFGIKSMKAWKLGGIIKVSDELLNDNMINFEDYMSNQIALGIDKAEAPAFCTGDGTNKPTGYVTSLTATAKTTTASASAITSSEVVSILYALPEAYRKRATWRMNSRTIQKIRNITDAQGRYVYKDEIKNGVLEGRPFVIDENLADMAANAKFLVFGDFSFYQIADRGNLTIQRLNEKYADRGLVGFRVTARLDAKRMLDEAFVVAQNAAA